MARMTRDALLVQSVLAPCEALPLHTVALRAFCTDGDGKPSPVALLRARRACQVLKEREVVDVIEGMGGLIVRSKDTTGNAASQLQAVMARVIHERELDEGPGVE